MLIFAGKKETVANCCKNRAKNSRKGAENTNLEQRSRACLNKVAERRITKIHLAKKAKISKVV